MALIHQAEKLGIDIQLNSFVLNVQDEASSSSAGPSVTLADGRTLTADIIVGADGIRSKVRESILGPEDVQPRDSTNCAYRATVPGKVMRADPQIAHLMDDINANCWIGPGRHIMAYPMRGGELYNLVMSHPASIPADRWSEPGKLEDMRAQYETFDPTIQRVLTKVESCLKWKLADIPPLPRWLSNNGGRVVLIGDAAHAMLPYLAQGAATAIEDGAALAECVGRASGKDEIPALLRAFVSIRKPRTEIIQAGSRANGDIWHLPDGAEQERRDRSMAGKGADQGNGGEQNPNRWSDKDFQPWLFGYDTIQEASHV
jgi:salicylate hydroxylase